MINYNDGKIFETVKEIPKHGEYDIVVAGGGVAGFGAAVAAAKRGYKTLLIEATSALGGLATMGLVNIPLDFISGVGKEMMSELDRLGGHWHRNTNVEIHKLVLDEMIKKYRDKDRWIKIDIYEQVMFRFNEFLDYVWEKGKSGCKKS